MSMRVLISSDDSGLAETPYMGNSKKQIRRNDRLKRSKSCVALLHDMVPKESMSDPLPSVYYQNDCQGNSSKLMVLPNMKNVQLETTKNLVSDKWYDTSAKTKLYIAKGNFKRGGCFEKPPLDDLHIETEDDEKNYMNPELRKNLAELRKQNDEILSKIDQISSQLKAVKIDNDSFNPKIKILMSHNKICLKVLDQLTRNINHVDDNNNKAMTETSMKDMGQKQTGSIQPEVLEEPVEKKDEQPIECYLGLGCYSSLQVIKPKDVENITETSFWRFLKKPHPNAGWFNDCESDTATANSTELTTEVVGCEGRWLGKDDISDVPMKVVEVKMTAKHEQVSQNVPQQVHKECCDNSNVMIGNNFQEKNLTKDIYPSGDSAEKDGKNCNDTSCLVPIQSKSRRRYSFKKSKHDVSNSVSSDPKNRGSLRRVRNIGKSFFWIA